MLTGKPALTAQETVPAAHLPTIALFAPVPILVPEVEFAQAAPTPATPVTDLMPAPVALVVSTSSKAFARPPAPPELSPTTVETVFALQELLPTEDVLPAAMPASLPLTELVYLAILTALHAQETSTSAHPASMDSLLTPAPSDACQLPNAHTVKNLTMETVKISVTVDSSIIKVSAFMEDALLDMSITDLEDVLEAAHLHQLLAAQLDSSCSMGSVFPTAVLDSMEILSVKNA